MNLSDPTGLRLIFIHLFNFDAKLLLQISLLQKDHGIFHQDSNRFFFIYYVSWIIVW